MNGFYISLDNPLLSEVSFYDFADFILQNGYDCLICDEVHFLKNWSSILKSIYDSHPNKKIIATDSSSLILRKGLGDLSRRFVTEKLKYVSFREYLFLKHQVLLEPVSWAELTHPLFYKKIPSLYKTNFNLQKEFKNYLAEGTRPIFLEGDHKQKTLNMIDKIIYSDIPYFLPEIKERHLQLLRHVIGHLALSPIPTLTIDSLAKNWAVSKTTVYNLLEIMNDSGILRIVAGKKQKTLSKGKKIFFSDPNLYSALEGNLGNVRESYFVMAIDKIDKNIICPDDDSEGDFIVDDLFFEVGGKNKSRKKSNFVVKDNIDAPTKGEIPIWILGFLAK
jgi:predicted AAA+ superfamily ATPase